jgi:beta-1,4-N-acetylglucosaminyltransferase
MGLDLTLLTSPLALCLLTALLLINLTFFRLSTILSAPPARTPPNAHLLIILGSGGHTAELLNILSSLADLHAFSKRTYVISTGDNFSAAKAVEFEKSVDGGVYNVITVRRARRVHQSIYTAPFTTLVCLYDCFHLLRQSPDLILTNGPGTGVCVVVAAVLRLFLGGRGMRSIYIESWARVKTLSLSGQILLPLVNRFIVQWPELAKAQGSRVEYIGPLVH